jgi:hypothetical protein
VSNQITFRVGRPPKKRIDWAGHVHALTVGITAGLLILAMFLPHRLDGDPHRWMCVAGEVR